MSSVTTTTIGALVRAGILVVGDGYRTKQSELASNGYRIIRVADIDNHSVSLRGRDFVSTSMRTAIGSKAAVSGDVLLTTKGTVGRVATMPDTDDLCVYSPQLCYFRVLDSSALNASFLQYWLLSPHFRAQSSYRKDNTDMAPYINLADIRSLEVRLPHPSEQQSIAEVLAALDDKIAVNARLSDLGIQLLEGRLSAADTFPVSLGEVADFHNSLRIPLSSREREFRVGPVPYYGAAGLIDTVDRPIFDGKYLLLGEDGSVVNDDGSPVTQYIWGPTWVNNHAHVVTGRGVSTEALTVAARRSDVRHLVTGAVQPKLSMANARKLVIHLPSIPSEREAFYASCESIFAVHRAIYEETQSLNMLRDTLLPELMSGRLKVKDAERQVEELV